MTNTQKRNQLVGLMTEGANKFSTLGFIAWWNVRGVEVTRDELIEMLKKADLDPKYARKHNYRSSFIRALKALEEQRIIRLVEENPTRMIYQFTSEVKIEDPDSPHFLYTPETNVVVDKTEYFESQDFEKALIKCDEQFKQHLVDLFNKERETYRSADVTRYVKSIFSDSADIIPLRQQGSVYFVPYVFKDVVDKVHSLLTQLGSSLEFAPLPDVGSSRSMVGNVVVDMISADLDKIKEEVHETQTQSIKRADRWTEYRNNQLNEIEARLDFYADAVDDDVLENLKQRVSEVRVELNR